MQETHGKSVMKGNLKTEKALSATERPNVVREEDKKVEDSVKMSRIVKDSERIRQKTLSSSPKLGQKKDDGK